MIGESVNGHHFAICCNTFIISKATMSYLTVPCHTMKGDRLRELVILLEILLKRGGGCGATSVYYGGKGTWKEIINIRHTILVEIISKCLDLTRGLDH
jgi:hypothetical protein